MIITDREIACPQCQHEALNLWVRADTWRGGYSVADWEASPCDQCGYELTEAELIRAVDRAVDAFEPPSRADLRDAARGI